MLIQGHFIVQPLLLVPAKISLWMRIDREGRSSWDQPDLDTEVLKRRWVSDWILATVVHDRVSYLLIAFDDLALIALSLYFRYFKRWFRRRGKRRGWPFLVSGLELQVYGYIIFGKYDEQKYNENIFESITVVQEAKISYARNQFWRLRFIDCAKVPVQKTSFIDTW